MSYRLKAINGPTQGSLFSLQKRMLLGRGKGADVQLVSRAASRRHARIRLLDGGQPVLEDLGSANGVYVNGKRIDRAKKLSWEDTFMVGKTTFVFEERKAGDEGEESVQLMSGAALTATRYDPNDDDMDEETLRTFIPDLAEFASFK